MADVAPFGTQATSPFRVFRVFRGQQSKSVPIRVFREHPIRDHSRRFAGNFPILFSYNSDVSWFNKSLWLRLSRARESVVKLPRWIILSRGLRGWAVKGSAVTSAAEYEPTC
jgi:hypothetical protein